MTSPQKDMSQPAARPKLNRVGFGLLIGMAAGLVLAPLFNATTAMGLSAGMFTGALAGIAFDPVRSARARWIAGVGIAAMVLLAGSRLLGSG